MSESILLANLKEYWQTGMDCLKNRKYNSAANEFFKAFITTCDIAIYRKLKLLPADHKERFEILKINLPELHKIDVSLFKVYRKSYTLRMSLEEVKRIQEGVKEVARSLKIEKTLETD